MRLDKFLKVSRILKRRTVANEVCAEGSVLVNGKPAKPSRELKNGDILTIRFASGDVRFEVLNAADKVKKDEERVRAVTE